MLSIAIVAEGYTDQIVIEKICLGIFEHAEEEPDIRYAFPFDNNPGGWTLVFKYLHNGEIPKILQVNDFVIIHIDTDVCEDKGFDVPRIINGVQRSPEELAQAVEARLIAEIGDGFPDYAHRVIFAIAVDEIECWLLPLLFESKSKAGKITGCLEAADHELKNKGQKRLRSQTGKNPAGYNDLAKSYTSLKVLDRHAKKNVSLERFVQIAIERFKDADQTK